MFGDLRTQATGEAKKHKSWGLIPIAQIKGKALWIWLSIEPHTVGRRPADSTRSGRLDSGRPVGGAARRGRSAAARACAA